MGGRWGSTQASARFGVPARLLGSQSRAASMRSLVRKGESVTTCLSELCVVEEGEHLGCARVFEFTHVLTFVFLVVERRCGR